MDARTIDAGLLQARYRLTKQRAAVLRALGDGKHHTAETLLERVRDELPLVSLGTVYRTLEILRGLGLVQSFSHGSLAARYEAVLDKHHHLLCSECHELTNVHADDVAAIARGIAERHGYREVDYQLTILGCCRHCSNGAGAASLSPKTPNGRSSSSAGNSP
ncbi:MAG: Fur family transcriptional regulator [Vulcanimicrobiaceae bacterium]